jgi:hypothetical protein
MSSSGSRPTLVNIAQPDRSTRLGETFTTTRTTSRQRGEHDDPPEAKADALMFVQHDRHPPLILA